MEMALKDSQFCVILFYLIMRLNQTLIFVKRLSFADKELIFKLFFSGPVNLLDSRDGFVTVHRGGLWTNLNYC